MYSAALNKFHNNQDARILLWLARAQYDLKQVSAAKRTLLKALHICPHDHTLLFNAALSMQQFASTVCSQDLRWYLTFRGDCMQFALLKDHSQPCSSLTFKLGTNLTAHTACGL
jgi:hypothetical protein